MRPRLFLTERKIEGLRSVREVREGLGAGRAGELWEALLAKVERERGEPAWTPWSALAQREANAVRHGNREYVLVALVANRIVDASLAALLSGRRELAESALKQIASVYDPKQWEELEDQTHLIARGDNCSLRRGQLAVAIGLAYDWLHPMLSGQERRWLVAGFDERITQAFRRALSKPDGWVRYNNNFIPAIVGGIGLAAMALGEDYEHSRWLLEVTEPWMDRHLRSIFGPEGEFNESVQYAGGAVGASVRYLTARRYFSEGRENPLERVPLAAFCRWYMHFVFPPGRVAGFGDPGAAMPPVAHYFGAVAAALRDPVLQWFYLQYAELGSDTHRSRALELLAYDPTLEAQAPDGVMPLGRAYHAQAKLVSSRSSWDGRSATSVVYAKAGHEHSHAHADWGQVCVDGFGERMIVDLGSTAGYPERKHMFYNYQQWGHNVLVIGNSDTGGVPLIAKGADGRPVEGQIIRSEFDARGGTWTMDLTPVYASQGARGVRRTVVHLLPRIVVVLDEVELDGPGEMDLRWHTIRPAAPDEEGNFGLHGDKACLAGRVMRLDGPATLRAGRHEYRPPYDKDRLGDAFGQRHEPYIGLRVRGQRCCLLALFAVFGPGEGIAQWTEEGDRWRIETPGGTVTVSFGKGRLLVRRGQGPEWDVSAGRHSGSSATENTEGTEERHQH